MTRTLLLMAAALPLAGNAPHVTRPDPAIEIACGKGPGEAGPNEVILHAGPNSARQLHVKIRSVSLDPRVPADTRTAMDVTAGEFAASCTTDAGGRHHLYLDTPEISEVKLTYRGYQQVTLRGLRGEQERSSVTVEPSGAVDANLTW